MKKLTKLDKVVPVPDAVFYGAYYYDGEDIDLCDDTEKLDEDGEHTYINVKDKIENDILYKEKILKVKMQDGRFIEEKTQKQLPLNKGDMLIYIMYEGFVKTRTKMIPINEAIERYNLLQNQKEE